MARKSTTDKVPEGCFNIIKEYNAFYSTRVTRDGLKFTPTNYEAEYQPQIFRVGKRSSKTFKPVYK